MLSSSFNESLLEKILMSNERQKERKREIENKEGN